MCRLYNPFDEKKKPIDNEILNVFMSIVLSYSLN